jgi:hypothetical protein
VVDIDQASVGFAVVDIELSFFILYGKAFAASGAIKDALCALAAPFARGGIPLYARYSIIRTLFLFMFSNILNSRLKLLSYPMVVLRVDNLDPRTSFKLIIVTEPSILFLSLKWLRESKTL